MHNPKVSVIMAVRNGEKTLSKTIDSILSQTFRDFEFVIVDDASNDSTPKILKEYKMRDERIRIITNKENMERCISRNSALVKSKGTYIAVTDADDISLPQRLEKEVEYLDSNPDTYLVGSRAIITDEEGVKIAESWGKKEDVEITDILREKNILVHSSVMFRNTSEFNYGEKFKYAQDYDLFLQMVREGKKLVLLKDFLVVYSDKKDIVYNDYLVKQIYYSEISRSMLRGEIAYEDFDNRELEQYVPEKLKLEMNLKQNFFNGRYKESRMYSKQLMKKDKSLWWKLYFVDSFLGGSLIRVGKGIKRIFTS